MLLATWSSRYLGAPVVRATKALILHWSVRPRPFCSLLQSGPLIVILIIMFFRLIIAQSLACTLLVASRI